jgi:hypothetical protein
MNEKSIHNQLKIKWNHTIVESVENVSAAGMADANCLHCGTEFWLEYKIIGHRSKTANIHIGHKIYLRPAQLAWHAKRAHHGGNAYVLAKDDNRLMLLSCDRQTIGLDEPLFKVVADFDKPFNWQELLEAILGDCNGIL